METTEMSEKLKHNEKESQNSECSDVIPETSEGEKNYDRKVEGKEVLELAMELEEEDVNHEIGDKHDTDSTLQKESKGKDVLNDEVIGSELQEEGIDVIPMDIDELDSTVCVKNKVRIIQVEDKVDKFDKKIAIENSPNLSLKVDTSDTSKNVKDDTDFKDVNKMKSHFKNEVEFTIKSSETSRNLKHKEESCVSTSGLKQEEMKLKRDAENNDICDGEVRDTQGLCKSNEYNVLGDSETEKEVLSYHCNDDNSEKSEICSQEKVDKVSNDNCNNVGTLGGLSNEKTSELQESRKKENSKISSNFLDKEQGLRDLAKEKLPSQIPEQEKSILVSDGEDEICVLSETKERSSSVVKHTRKDKHSVLNVKLKDNVKSKNNDIICLDAKPDDDILICEDNQKPRKQCCNLECESRETLINAPVAVLTYYGSKYVKGKSHKVCRRCFEIAVSHQELLAYALMEHKPLLKEKFPIRKDIALIDDSDDEDSDEEPPLGEHILLDVDDKLMEVIDSSLENYDLDFQIKESDAILQETFDNLSDEFMKTDEVFNKLQADIDELRAKLYRGFAPKIKELSSLDIMDTPDFNSSPEKKSKMQNLTNIYISPTKRPQSYVTSPDSPRRSPLGVATKKVTQVQRNAYPALPQNDQSQELSLVPLAQQEVVALEQVQQVRPVLPPIGQLSRPRPNIHDVLYVMKNGYYGMWARAKVLEVISRPDTNNPNKMEYQYKIKFESRKSSLVKNVNGKQIAYNQPSPVRLPVGTRVVALFRDEWAKECYYAGIIAEPPKSMNKYRYLVFFDDGYAQYVCHEKILLVCESSRNVWDDIHPDSRDFVRNYLEQYPERPMLKLQRGQIVKTEWNGKWWIARVEEVNGSLVKMHFDADGRTELIYRGSTRLGPLYSELANAAARKNLGSFTRHRTMGISSLKRRNMPYVEYTRSDLDENKLEDSGVTITILGSSLREISRSLEKTIPSRAVAKKSTSRRTDSATEQLEALILTSDRDIQSGHVESIYISPSYKPKMFAPHQCGHRCIEGIMYDASQIKYYNPLVLPQLHGWQRHITRCKGKKIVIYRSPCGRRLRNMEELHRYLRVTRSNLSVDLFDYDPWVHCFSEFVMRAGFINIKDLSYGHENVPVPCVNNVDHSKPEYVKYSTVRLPMEGVNVNTDPEYLVCCDCTDDCQNKEKCACWQLTIQGTAYASGGKVDTSVGYWYKRLREPVTTGIYECNSRCKCASTCLNRVAQNPLELRLQVFKTENRGWGIRCLNDVPHGAFICIYAGRLLTEQGANEGGKTYGDEYLAELDYIEVVERLKEGYESDVVEDDDAPYNSSKVEKAKKGALSEEDEEEDGENNQDAHDSDFELDSKHQHLNVAPLEESTIRTRLRNRKARNSSIDSEGKDGGKDNESITSEKAIKKPEGERKGSVLSSDDASSLITLSDDEDDEQREREPSRFAAMSDPKKETEKKVSYKSVREYFGDDECCYIMDAKNDGNIGRYLNHSCSPNVFVQNVFVDTHDLRFPWVAFFALTYISAGTELTWDYNYDVGSVPSKVLHCYCGSSDCRGRLL